MGVLLYTLLVGHLPFDDSNLNVLYSQINVCIKVDDKCKVRNLTKKYGKFDTGLSGQTIC